MEDHGAFVEKFELRPPPLQSSTAPLLCLSGLTFSVKEMFDISGRVTGFGNPEWARTHPPATTTSPTILALLQAGAVCVGRTVMDEMAYSINGENKHYGTPINPCAKDRVPGGSSSGSAVSVAAKLVDFSLGTDTGGSVRVPASYCGIFGIRPSHGAVDSTGVIPMAQSFDCVGWFSRDATILAGVGDVLLPPSASANHMPTRVLVPDDCFQLLSSSIGRQCEIFSNSIGRVVRELVHLNLGEYIKDKVPSLNYFLHRQSKAGVLNLSGIPELSALAYAMQTLQRFEFKANHEDWVNTVRPDLGPGTSERVWEAINFADLDAIPHCISLKSQLRTALNELLTDDAVLLLPTVPGPPPKLNTDVSLLKDFRSKAFGLLSIAGISGLCQITIPLGMVDDLPASISVLASHGTDRFLLEFVKNFFSSSAKVDTTKL